MTKSQLIIASFIITALWDVALRIMAENYNQLPSYFRNMMFIKYLIPYFKEHTLLAAALIAGFVGAGAQFIILNIHSFPTKLTNLTHIISFLIVSYIVSALYGFLMKASQLFPHLDATYYKKLGSLKGAYYDGWSGLIVQLTLLFFFFMYKWIKK